MMNAHKYKAQRTSDGFPSKLEKAVYEMLLLRIKSGEISNLKRQQVVHLGRGVKWKVDFSFIDVKSGETVYAEAKGFEDQVYKLKLSMWVNGGGPGKLEIWKGSHQRPWIHKVIAPKISSISHQDEQGCIRNDF